MIYLHVTSGDLQRLRFAISPMRETTLSLRALAAAGGGAHLHRRWRDRVATVVTTLPPHQRALLAALVRPQGYIPDFLSTPPRRRTASFGQELTQLAGSDRGTVATELRHLAAHRLAQQGPGAARRRELLHQLADRPDAGLAAITAALRAYHHAVIAPDWPRIRALLQDDITYRLQTLADGGVAEMMRDLHPNVSFTADTIRVVKYYEGHTDLAGRGLTLVPSAFAWPDVIVRTAQPDAPMLSYSPRGVGRLWEHQPSTADSALAEVIGRTRAALLAQLDLPMSTTQAATTLALSAPSVNVHLQSLRRAGLLTATPDGRRVLYARTDLGTRLLLGATSD